MPKGPQGQTRLADVIGNAMLFAKIATGGSEDMGFKQLAKAKSGRAGVKACAESLTAQERSMIARKVATGRWV